MDPVSDIFAAFGDSPTQLARATGLSVSTVCDWRTKGPRNIPKWRRGQVLNAIQREGKSVAAETLVYLADPSSAA